MNNDLAPLRVEIDRIDNELVRLFAERMAVCEQIANVKKAQGKPTYDAARERAKLLDVLSKSPEELVPYTHALYNEIFELSHTWQNRITTTPSPYCEIITRALETTPKVFPGMATVACQGVEGAYQQQAVSRLFATPDIRYYKDFESVFVAIENGECDYGVLPVENSTAGSVNQIYDLMMQYRFSIVRSVRLKIDHNLLVKPGTTFDQIREVYSHEQALAQCAGFFKAHPEIHANVYPNTAMAAQAVAQSERSDVAALSSAACAGLYGLKILERNVQDNSNNFTRFICISKAPQIFPGADRTSIMLTTPHKPGSLFRILSRINALGVNLTKIESRPLPDRNFEFMFYFDLEMSVYSDAFLQLINELDHQSESFEYLGSYSEVV